MNWIIGIGGSAMDNVVTYRVSGTKEKVKKQLVKEIIKDQANDPGEWVNGTTNIYEITEEKSGRLYGYGCYAYYHLDYTATPEMDVVAL